MKTYFEAYYADGGQILGNLDGQGVTEAKNYKRTKRYKALYYGLRRPLWPKVAYWRVTQNDNVVETIINLYAKDQP